MGATMAQYEVETTLIVHCKVRVLVEAAGKEAAIDACADLLPANHDRTRARAWKATVALKAPKGVVIEFVGTEHFEQASGADKARLKKPAAA